MLVSADEIAPSTVRPGAVNSSPVNSQGLSEKLKAKIKGEVRFDPGSRALYATDGSNYRQVPIGVVIPRDADDVVATVATCREFGAPILSRGGGTSLAGQCCNVAVIMDMSKYMNAILELNPGERYARIQPGIVLDRLRDAANKFNLTFGPDPATHNHCTLGGMMGNNSCGVHSVMAGRTVENIEELEILTYDGLRMRVGKTSDAELDGIIREGGRRGQIYQRMRELRDRYADRIRQRYPRIPRRVSGYNLDELLPENGFDVAKALIGSESTLVTILEAKTRLVYWPPFRNLLVLGYPDIATAGDHVMEVLEHKPQGLEGIDQDFIDDMKKKGLHPEDLNLMPEGNGFLLIEWGGENREEADGKARKLMDELQKQPHPPSMKLFDNPAEEKMIWTVRESGLGATAIVPGQKENWEGWEDSAVPPEKVGPYLRELRKLLDKYKYNCPLYGHLGDGCIHTRIDFDLKTEKGIRDFRSFLQEAAEMVIRYGGSLSGEHGDGQARAELLPLMFGEELVEAFAEFKSIWDPEWKMNPGKVVHPYKITENLRYGTHYNPPNPSTHFQWPEDHFSFSRAMERCVGVGECRKTEHGAMCPSYMVTREEMHSTRGRARLLFEMLEGNPLEGGWKSEQVKEALDLCLSCKGCKGDCPVNVDMATYKAEFLSHYYGGRPRPRTAYAMGLIYWWARIGSRFPRLTNLMTQTPGLRAVMKALGGISQERRIPRFANRTFKEWFQKRRSRNLGRPKVILWADTFNNHFHPHVARAAVEVLEDAGFHVTVPEQSLCCGRPLYDYGMLDLAKKMLERILAALDKDIADGVPVVALEPSCAAVFRDEIYGLFPHNENAKRLRDQTFLLSEFLEKKAQDYRPPQLKRKAVLHGHCHHKAIMKMDAEHKVLEKLGLDYHEVDSGCCGMAGSFGFEANHYDISMKIGERRLLPEVRKAEKSTLIIADGFSCKEQIAQTTDRKAMHLAEVLQMAMYQNGKAVAYPEKQKMLAQGPEERANLQTAAILGASVLLTGASLAWLWKRR